MTEEPRDLLGAYREALGDLRRTAGPLGALVAPLQLQADVLERLVGRQGELEGRVAAAIAPFATVAELTREAPAALRTQAKAFEAASTAFKQAAEVMRVQADVLERTLGALSVPGGVLRQLRGSDEA